MGAVFYAASCGGLFLLQIFTPNVRWRLPERQGGGGASLAGIFYWRVGWVFPTLVVATALLQRKDLTAPDRSVAVAAFAVMCVAGYSLLVEPHW